MQKSQRESSIYFTEKDIYDALMSSKRTMTIPLIMELARDKGILLSSEDSRETLVKYLSTLVYDYYDLNVLIDHITPSHKKEKSKVSKIDTKITSAQLKTITKELAESSTTIQVTTDSDDSKKTILKIEYDEIDLSKTRLRQKIRKESVIEITEEENSTKISKPSNSAVDSIMSNIISAIEKKNDSTINEEKINLYNWEHEKIIEYFTTLINSIQGCKLSDVIKVTVNNEDNPEAEEDVLNLITNASFKGKGLLSTEEYQKLKTNGYYITSIVWISNETTKNGNIIEFEASLSSSKNCDEVIFLAKGVYRFVEKDKYTSTRRPLNTEEIIKYTQYLEEAALSVYSDLKPKEI
jgi:hypothetical protein